MISLDQALDRLLHHRAYRAAFLSNRFDALDLAPEDLEALESIDRRELVRTAERVAKDLIGRKHRGSGGLLELYPKTLGVDRLGPTAPEPRRLETVYRFLESAAFRDYREIPFAGVGTSLEEAFFRFCEAEEIGEPIVREQEFLLATMKALLVSPSPTFCLPDCVRRGPTGFFAVTTRGAPMLFAAVRGRLVTGELTPFLVEVLLGPDGPAEIAARHGVEPAVLAASLERLRALGLWSAG